MDELLLVLLFWIGTGTLVAFVLSIAALVRLRRPVRRELAAGKWARPYFTTYAMHGVTATRVLEDPTLAIALVLRVAGGMIGHSHYFRTEAVNALAFSGPTGGECGNGQPEF